MPGFKLIPQRMRGAMDRPGPVTVPLTPPLPASRALVYCAHMPTNSPKSIRRKILVLLYDRYQLNPLDMLTPEDFLENGSLEREGLVSNVHYLADSGLIELMIGYNPPWFAAARITAKGIDLVENQFEFNLRFPPTGDSSQGAGEILIRIAWLMERLIEEAEFSALDGERRRCLLRDVQFLRDEISRPPTRWRTKVIDVVLGWIEDHFYYSEEEGLPSFVALKEALAQAAQENQS
ncbi:MAG: hypothetical protein AMXMBFR84_37140 [Candidatus Hydrogenedentota bacterium]